MVKEKLLPTLCVLLAVVLLLEISWLWYNKDISPVVYSDVEGYYMYLPATFIYHGFENIPVKTRGEFHRYGDTNKWFTKYPCGVAIMQLPFFLAAHATTIITKKYPADGYSFFYTLSVMLAGIFYSVTGMYLMLQVLRRKFSFAVSFISVLLIFAGTNMYYYTIGSAGMSHIYSFFLFSALVFLTPKLFAAPTRTTWILYGLLLGMIVLTRPTNSIMFLYPLLYGVYSWKGFTDKFRFLKKNIPHVALATLCFFAVFIPQLIYWKYISGSFVMWSYVDEGFIYWNRPKIGEVLFGVQNGWLLYSPLLVFALAGLVPAFRQRAREVVAIPLMLLIATYLFASWWAYWYGGAFGHRCFVEYYSLLLIPLAYFISMALAQKLWIRSVLFLLMACTVYYSLGLHYLYSPPWDGPNWNWGTFGAVCGKLI